MKVERDNFSSIECRPKHSALTHFFRRNWWRDPKVLVAILAKCDVSPYFGALPPELRARVPKENLGVVTQQFRMILEDFLMDKKYQILSCKRAQTYDLSVLGKLFGLTCRLHIGGMEADAPLGIEFRHWSGAFSIVGKMSFPEIGADYALKIFNLDYFKGRSHGSMYEIPTALAAAHAEPKDNARVYMASLVNDNYMLSRWEGDDIDRKIRENKNEIFVTSSSESAWRNYRGGRRIDFGETYLTVYGRAEYPIRKMYRQLLSPRGTLNLEIMANLKQKYSRNPRAMRDLERAIDMASYVSVQNLYEHATPQVRKFFHELVSPYGILNQDAVMRLRQECASDWSAIADLNTAIDLARNIAVANSR